MGYLFWIQNGFSNLEHTAENVRKNILKILTFDQLHIKKLFSSLYKSKSPHYVTERIN